VASKGTGRLVYLGVVEGDKVIKDQIMLKLKIAIFGLNSKGKKRT